MEMHDENEKLMGLYEITMHERDELRMLSSDEQKRVREKLIEVDGEKCLQSLASSLNVEQAFIEFDKVLREIEVTEEGLQLKQELIRSHELLSSEIQEKRALVDKKLSALR
ncbi:hypothetical protein OIU74_001628 [Salix koriyanagi]|uniref:Uncharacterized protein n=1 Tax=Salix koriyanagi TaxID=2511006 RepID=A0A9Q0X2T1_9ROSI|nr:hypothetical protein OIU74_001628 [Salix koriyanagi]